MAGFGGNFTDLVVILGPTGSGKSALAMALARRLGADVLSVDSMQVYRGMDIGTAKPSVAEKAEVRHHAVDVVDPTETFTVARFVEIADAAIADCREREVPLIACGGTPLYYKALFEGLFEGPPANAELRARLQQQSNESMHERLGEVDPAAAARIHVNDRVRMVRALEVHELTGRAITDWQQQWNPERHRHDALWLGMAWEREAINRRINARVKEMMAAGWLQETGGLLHRYGELSQTAAEATGYAELIAHLRGKISLDDAVEQIKIGTRQLARRQMKWFKRFRAVQWLDGAAGEDLVRRAETAIGGSVR